MKKYIFFSISLIFTGLFAEKTSVLSSKSKSEEADFKNNKDDNAENPLDGLGTALAISQLVKTPPSYDSLSPIEKEIGKYIVQGAVETLKDDRFQNELNILSEALERFLGNTINLLLENSKFSSAAKQEIKNNLRMLKDSFDHKNLFDKLPQDIQVKPQAKSKSKNEIKKTSNAEAQKTEKLEAADDKIQNFMMSIGVAIKHDAPNLVLPAFGLVMEHGKNLSKKAVELINGVLDKAIDGLQESKKPKAEKK